MSYSPNIFRGTKAQCKKWCRENGYTVDNGEGECGDYGWGSRLYFAQPDSPENSFGVALCHAVVSKMPGGWIVTTFGDEHKAA